MVVVEMEVEVVEVVVEVEVAVEEVAGARTAGIRER